MAAWKNVLDERDLPGILAISVLTGTIIQSAALATPSGYVLCDGSAYNRSGSGYDNLFATITIIQAGNVVSGLATVTGLSDTSLMVPGYPVSGNNIPGGTFILSVDSSTQVTLTNNASGTSATLLCVAPYGTGNGVTTFNVPNLVSSFAQGPGGTDILGGTGGAVSPTITDPGHSHSIPQAGLKSTGGQPCNNASPTGTATTGISIADARPPFQVVNFFIKT